MRTEQLHRLRAVVDADAERLGDGVRRDVVMRRPDAARREHIVVTRANLVQRCNDHLFDIGNDARLTHLHADPVEMRRDIGKVRIARAARQNLIPDQQHAGGNERGAR